VQTALESPDAPNQRRGSAALATRRSGSARDAADESRPEPTLLTTPLNRHGDPSRGHPAGAAVHEGSPTSGQLADLP